MISYFKGLHDCFRGFGLILKPGVRQFVIAPLIINIAAFSAAIYFLIQEIENWIQSLLPGWLMWLEWLIWPIIAFTVFLIVFYSFALLANLIAAPFNSLLAARVEASITQTSAATAAPETYWKLILRSIGSELKKLSYFIAWLIPLCIITIIPVINIVAPFCWLLYAAWSFALEYTDYPLANHGRYFPEIKQHNRNHRMRSLGFGTGVFLMTSIPLLNFLAMPVAVAGATHLTVKTGSQT